MKAKKFFAGFIISVSLIACFIRCEKKTESPKQACKTCIAKSNLEGTIKTEEVCSDEAEQTFRNTYSDYQVTCGQ